MTDRKWVNHSDSNVLPSCFASVSELNVQERPHIKEEVKRAFNLLNRVSEMMTRLDIAKHRNIQVGGQTSHFKNNSYLWDEHRC